ISHNAHRKRLPPPFPPPFPPPLSQLPCEEVIMASFGIGLWHPFGPHAGETADQIIDRKRGEIEINGWTLWTFQYRRPEVLEAWQRALSANSLPRLVFCSNSKGAKDPDDGASRVVTIDSRSYLEIGEATRRSIPVGVRVPHPFRKGKTQASAFVVKRIIHPVE